MDSFRSSLEPVLGTRLGIRVECADAHVAAAAESAIEAEAERLESILSIYRPGSAMSRWRRGELDHAPAEVVAVLTLALAWYERTDGGFNPFLGAVSERWRLAERTQRLPDRAEIAELAAAARPPYTVDGGVVVRCAGCERVDVHGIAKGWVVDRLADVAQQVSGVDALLIELGGDLRYLGGPAAVGVRIGVENPFAVADNAEPLTVVRLAAGGMATSGGGRRGWRIGGRWFGHLLDPRTGWPLPAERSATAIAGTTADADASASAAASGGIDAPGTAGTAVLVVDADGRSARNARWRSTIDEERNPG